MPFPKGALHPSRKRAEYVAARDARKRESKAKSNAKRRALDVEAGAVEGERASRSPPPYAKRTKAAKRGDIAARVRATAEAYPQLTQQQIGWRHEVSHKTVSVLLRRDPLPAAGGRPMVTSPEERAVLREIVAEDPSGRLKDYALEFKRRCRRTLKPAQIGAALKYDGDEGYKAITTTKRL
jgi:hypothetical protein